MTIARILIFKEVDYIFWRIKVHVVGPKPGLAKVGF